MHLNDQPENIISASEITEQAMSALYSVVIEPMESNLEQEDLDLIGVIGLALKIVGEKATLYEEMAQNGHGSNYGGSQNFSRN